MTCTCFSMSQRFHFGTKYSTSKWMTYYFAKIELGWEKIIDNSYSYYLQKKIREKWLILSLKSKIPA